ncbi:hypothetical protein JEQ12_013013 [Ovis aries]|uniref:C-type lectin domain-containing protein n=1 Tax=Ovis aries TaxID=9940 RepID=A0A835ZN64_SHEEP|nr:hypothetical protein JEQ12_013013 [Ovis aries]
MGDIKTSTFRKQKRKRGGVGAPGMQGSPGPTGLKEERGAPGEPGAPGSAGAAGPAGAIGPQGPSGARGPPGLKGDRGSPGEKGAKGESGLAEVNALRQRVTILEGHLRRFQNAFSQYKKVVLFPDGQAVGEKIFKMAGVVKSYSDAQQLCTEAKGQLASPRSAAENEAVTQLARAHKENAYLSMNDISTEGRFTYPTGEILVYSNWASGEPNNSNDGQPEHCVEIYPEGKWNDIPCSILVLKTTTLVSSEVCDYETEGLQVCLVQLEERLFLPAWDLQAHQAPKENLDPKRCSSLMAGVSGRRSSRFQAAQQICTQAREQLPSPCSAAENEALTQLATAQNKAAFLSMTDTRNEGIYPTGELLVYSLWAPP